MTTDMAVAEALARLAKAASDMHTVHVYECRVSTVNTTAKTCVLTDNTLGTLTAVPYIGRPPVVGQRILYLTFDRLGYALGGEG